MFYVDLLVFFRDHAPEDLFSEIGGKLLAGQLCVSHNTDERSFQFAYVGFYLLRKEEQHVLGDADRFIFGLFPEDRAPCFEVRRLYVGYKPPREPGHQALFKVRDVLRRSVARDDYLLVRIVKLIECMEKLFLGGLFAGYELYIVHEQHVNVSIHIPEIRSGPGADGLYQLVGELLAGYV